MSTDVREPNRREAATQAPTPTPPRPGKALTIGAVCKQLEREFP